MCAYDGVYNTLISKVLHYVIFECALFSSKCCRILESIKIFIKNAIKSFRENLTIFCCGELLKILCILKLS